MVSRVNVTFDKYGELEIVTLQYNNGKWTRATELSKIAGISHVRTALAKVSNENKLSWHQIKHYFSNDVFHHLTTFVNKKGLEEIFGVSETNDPFSAALPKEIKKIYYEEGKVENQTKPTQEKPLSKGPEMPTMSVYPRISKHAVVYCGAHLNLTVVQLTKEDRECVYAIDVAVTMGYDCARNAISRHVSGKNKIVWEQMVCNYKGNIDRNMFQATSVFLYEEGINELALASTKPFAKQLRSYLATEVMPALRQHGYYKSKDARLQVKEVQPFVAEDSSSTLSPEELVRENRNLKRTFGQIYGTIQNYSQSIKTTMELKENTIAKLTSQISDCYKNNAELLQQFKEFVDKKENQIKEILEHKEQQVMAILNEKDKLYQEKQDLVIQCQQILNEKEKQINQRDEVWMQQLHSLVGTVREVSARAVTYPSNPQVVPTLLITRPDSKRFRMVTGQKVYVERMEKKVDPSERVFCGTNPNPELKITNFCETLTEQGVPYEKKGKKELCFPNTPAADRFQEYVDVNLGNPYN